jgi:hypothetical protein
MSSTETSGSAPAGGVQEDLRLIVSGNFSEDALGPDVYRAIVARVEAAPRAYLQAFRALVARVRGEGMDPGRLSSLHLPWFLTLLARTDPDAAREGARELLGVYEHATRAAGLPGPGMRGVEKRGPPATEDEKLADRLHSRAAELQRLLQP